MLTLKVTMIGNAEGVILHDEVKAKLGGRNGDKLFLTEAPDGALRITPYHPDVERQLALAEQIMRDDQEILQALAK